MPIEVVFEEREVVAEANYGTLEVAEPNFFANQTNGRGLIAADAVEAGLDAVAANGSHGEEGPVFRLQGFVAKKLTYNDGTEAAMEEDAAKFSGAGKVTRVHNFNSEAAFLCFRQEPQVGPFPRGD